MNDLYMRILSGLMIHKEDRKIFREAFHPVPKSPIISPIPNLINLLSNVDDKIALLKKNLALIEIETFSFCNRQCWFCPNSFIDRHSKNEYMEEDVYLKIINELSEINYSGIITYSRYNEPFADRVILERIKQAREKLPNANLYTHTNGDYLTKEYLGEIANAGMNTLKIQYYLAKDEKYDKEKILENMKKQVKRFADKYNITAYTDDYVEMTIINDQMDIVYQAIKFEDYACDRGGTLDLGASYKREKFCLIPLSNMYIDYTGAAMPCCNLRSDIEKHKNFIMGNVKESSLAEIFGGNKYVGLRKQLFTNDILIKPCSSCKFALDYCPQI